MALRLRAAGLACRRAPLLAQRSACCTLRARPLSAAAAAPEAKSWLTAGACLEDHAAVFASLPKILGAYVGSNSLSPQLGESIMVAVNSANACPYCEGLHGELARMAGVDGSADLQAASSVAECTAVVDDVAISFARTFADCGGRGEEVDAALAEVAAEHGEGKAASVEALCWFLTWGSLGGNTLNAVLFEGRRGAFEIAFAVYYAPLFVSAPSSPLPPSLPSAVAQILSRDALRAGGD